MHTRREIKYHIYSQILNKNAVQSLINILFVCRITPQLQQNLLLYSIPGPSSAAGYAQVHLQGGSFRPSQYLHQHSSADSVPLKFIRYPFPPTVGFLFLACQQQREKKKKTHNKSLILLQPAGSSASSCLSGCDVPVLVHLHPPVPEGKIHQEAGKSKTSCLLLSGCPCCSTQLRQISASSAP